MTEPAMKQVCVFGGSNSIKEGIWTTGLSELLPPNFTFLNGSVGAVSGIMAYCRLAAMDQLKRRDVVLWEYALNDQNYVDKLGHYPELLLRFCEHTIRLCRSRGLRFIPLIFAGRNATERGEMTPYRRDLRQLFDHYSIQYLDVSEELPKILDRKRVPDYVYQDKSHYKEDAFVGRFIAKRALKLIRSGAGWVAAADRLRGEDVTGVQLISRFDSGESQDFSNSRVTVDCFVPTDTGEPVSVRTGWGISGKSRKPLFCDFRHLRRNKIYQTVAEILCADRRCCRGLHLSGGDRHRPCLGRRIDALDHRLQLCCQADRATVARPGIRSRRSGAGAADRIGQTCAPPDCLLPPRALSEGQPPRPKGEPP